MGSCLISCQLNRIRMFHVLFIFHSFFSTVVNKVSQRTNPGVNNDDVPYPPSGRDAHGGVWKHVEERTLGSQSCLRAQQQPDFFF